MDQKLAEMNKPFNAQWNIALDQMRNDIGEIPIKEDKGQEESIVKAHYQERLAEMESKAKSGRTDSDPHEK